MKWEYTLECFLSQAAPDVLNVDDLNALASNGLVQRPKPSAAAGADFPVAG
jgi:hypothetical protein